METESMLTKEWETGQNGKLTGHRTNTCTNKTKQNEAN